MEGANEMVELDILIPDELFRLVEKWLPQQIKQLKR